MRALRKRYGRAQGRTYQTAYGTRVDGWRILSETRKVLATFPSREVAVRAWEILAAYEGAWGDSADTFDSAEWRKVRAAWEKAGLR